MIDKLKNLKWHFQLILLVVIAALLYLSVWYFVTGPTREEVAKLSDEVSQLKAKNESAKIATQRINEFRALYASKSAEYDELKVLLPEQREITNVLQGLQDNARDSRMIVMRFSPRDDTQKDSIMAKQVEIEVDSNFTNVRAFFEKMAKLPRIVSISDFKVNQLDKQTAEKTIHAQFLLTASYPGPKRFAAKHPNPGKPGAPAPAPGQPAPAQPAAPASK